MPREQFAGGLVADLHPHFFKDFPVADFQVYQGANAAVEVRLIPTEASAEIGLSPPAVWAEIT